MTPCSECGTKKAIHGRERCQRCERLAVHGPVHQPKCDRCRDSGLVYAGRCDIPGCVHWRLCGCSRVTDSCEDLSRGLMEAIV